MIDVFLTSREPMRDFIDRMKALEGQDGTLSVSLIYGFMAADVTKMGTKVLVVADGAREKAQALAERLGREIFAQRGKVTMPMLGIEAGLARAAEVARGKPVVIADVWDNPGGGVAGDGTLILRLVVERGFDDFAVATIWGPIAVSFCRAAREDAWLQLRFGGKCDAKAGAQLDAEVEVLKAQAKGWHSFGASRVPLAPTALVRIVGTNIEVILNTNRTQTFEPDVFFNLSVDPLAKRILLVKSTNHFYAGFALVASEVVYADAGANYPSDPLVADYHKLARPIWPRVEAPFASDEFGEGGRRKLARLHPL